VTNFDDLLRLWLNLHVHLRHLYAMWRFVTYFMETFLEMCLSIAHRVTVETVGPSTFHLQINVNIAHCTRYYKCSFSRRAPSAWEGFSPVPPIHGTKMLTGEE